MILTIMLLKRAGAYRREAGFFEAVVGTALGLLVALVLFMSSPSGATDRTACAPGAVAFDASGCAVPASFTAPWAPPAPKSAPVLPAIEPNVAR